MYHFLTKKFATELLYVAKDILLEIKEMCLCFYFLFFGFLKRTKVSVGTPIQKDPPPTRTHTYMPHCHVQINFKPEKPTDQARFQTTRFKDNQQNATFGEDLPTPYYNKLLFMIEGPSIYPHS